MFETCPCATVEQFPLLASFLRVMWATRVTRPFLYVCPYSSRQPQLVRWDLLSTHTECPCFCLQRYTYKWLYQCTLCGCLEASPRPASQPASQPASHLHHCEKWVHNIYISFFCVCVYVVPFIQWCRTDTVSYITALRELYEYIKVVMNIVRHAGIASWLVEQWVCSNVICE